MLPPYLNCSHVEIWVDQGEVSCCSKKVCCAHEYYTVKSLFHNVSSILLYIWTWVPVIFYSACQCNIFFTCMKILQIICQNCSFCTPFYPLTQEKGLFKWNGLQSINMVTLLYIFWYCFYFLSYLKKREVECLRKMQVVKVCRIHCVTVLPFP
jgi:hypothetical protein